MVASSLAVSGRQLIAHPLGGTVNHEDYLWISLRLLGFYLLFKALESAIGAVSNVQFAFFGSDAVLRDRSLVYLVGNSVEFVIFGWLGRYLVLDGRRLLSWALRNQRTDSK